MDKGAKFTGLLVFIAGVALLVMVFMTAVHLFQATHAATPDLKKLPGEGYTLLARFALLFAMGYVASAIAGRGVQLFEATLPRVEEKK
ncbi:MAG TPA: hypothetical protein VGM37_15435 [Armatimonadota bacterium]|jgi:hypothetical protein